MIQNSFWYTQENNRDIIIIIIVDHEGRTLTRKALTPSDQHLSVLFVSSVACLCECVGVCVFHQVCRHVNVFGVCVVLRVFSSVRGGAPLSVFPYFVSLKNYRNHPLN
jgi:hypothetical protein